MFTSILSSIIIWSAVLIIALRVVTNSGIQFSNNKYISELTCYKGTSSNYETTKKDILCVFLLAFSFRIIVFLFSVVIIYMFNDSINSFGDILELQADIHTIRKVKILQLLHFFRYILGL